MDAPVYEHFFIGLYWYSRKQTIREGAETLCRVLHEISKLDERFGKLDFAFVKKNKPVIQFDFCRHPTENIDLLGNSILDWKLGSIKKYHPGTIPSVEFHESIGSSAAFDAREIKKLSFTCNLGAYADPIANTFLVEIPKDFVCEYRFMYNLFTTLIAELNPAHATVTSNRFQRVVVDQPLPYFRIGWFNYFSNKLMMPRLDSRIRTEKLSNGVLTCTTADNEKFSCDNAVHAGNAKYMIGLFKKQNFTLHSNFKVN